MYPFSKSCFFNLSWSLPKDDLLTFEIVSKAFNRDTPLRNKWFELIIQSTLMIGFYPGLKHIFANFFFYFVLVPIFFPYYFLLLIKLYLF